jgi:hypothetical protein
MQRYRVWLTKWEKIQVLKILRWPIRVPKCLETLIVCPRQSIFWLCVIKFVSDKGLNFLCAKSYFEFFSHSRYTTERWSTWAYWKFYQMTRTSDFSELYPTVYFLYTHCRGSDLTFTTPTIKRPLTNKMRLIYTNQSDSSKISER